MPNINSAYRLSPEHVAILRAYVCERGEVAAARELGIPRNTIVRALSGLGMREGTVTLVTQRLSDADLGLGSGADVGSVRSYLPDVVA